MVSGQSRRKTLLRKIRISGIKNVIVIIIIVILLTVLLIRKIVNSVDTVEELGQEVHSENVYLTLENILKAKHHPKHGKNIFFLDTTRMKRRKKERAFTCRQACAVESAALMNPHLKIFVTFVSRHKHDNKISFTRHVEAMLRYRNVYVNRLDLIKFSKSTPMENFFKSDKLNSSHFIVSHTSDALRFLILWKYGGTYLDSDVIVQKRLDSVPANYVCDETDNAVNGAVINIERGFKGRWLAKLFMDELIQNFNGTVWGSNGPLLITRVLHNLCKTNETQQMIEMGDCEGFHVLPNNLCYPILGLGWEKLFKESEAEKCQKAAADSIVVHFWNNLSKKTSLKADSNAFYTQLGRKFCPKVMQACGENF